MRKLKLFLLILMLITPVNNACAADIEGSVFGKVGRIYRVDPYLIYAVALQESNRKSERKNYIKPHPYTLNCKGKSYYFSDYESAEKKLKELLKKGQSVDVGLMQINTFWHRDKIPEGREEILLDPLANVALGATILKKSLKSSENPCLAVGHYHSWNDNLASPYGCKVLKIYKKLINLEVN